MRRPNVDPLIGCLHQPSFIIFLWSLIFFFPTFQLDNFSENTDMRRPNVGLSTGCLYQPSFIIFLRSSNYEDTWWKRGECNSELVDSSVFPWKFIISISQWVIFHTFNFHGNFGVCTNVRKNHILKYWRVIFSHLYVSILVFSKIAPFGIAGLCVLYCRETILLYVDSTFVGVYLDLLTLIKERHILFTIGYIVRSMIFSYLGMQKFLPIGVGRRVYSRSCVLFYNYLCPIWPLDSNWHILWGFLKIQVKCAQHVEGFSNNFFAKYFSNDLMRGMSFPTYSAYYREMLPPTSKKPHTSI